MTFRALTSLFLIASLSLACSKDNAGATPAASAAAKPATPAPSAATSAAPTAEASAKPRRDLRGGVAATLVNAARTLDLKEPQKDGLGKIEEKLRAAETPRDEFKQLEAELVLQVKGGKIEAAKLAPKHAAVDKAIEAQKGQELESIASLHALLDGPQRKAVVTTLRAKQAAREERMAQRKDDKKDDPAARLKLRLERMTKELDLDAAQQKTVETFLAKNAPKDDPMVEAKKHMDALLEAFEKDAFDGKKLDVFGKKGAAGRVEVEEGLLTQLVPSLKPEQREKLAAKMERSGHKGRGGDMPGRPFGDDHKEP